MGLVDRHAVNNFAQKVLLLIEAQNLTGGSKVHVTFGRRNARIVHVWGGQHQCWGWVDMTDGTIRRGSWKSPDMRVPGRGKITDPDIMKTMLWTGPPYLK